MLGEVHRSGLVVRHYAAVGVVLLSVVCGGCKTKQKSETTRGSACKLPPAPKPAAGEVAPFRASPRWSLFLSEYRKKKLSARRDRIVRAYWSWLQRHIPGKRPSITADTSGLGMVFFEHHQPWLEGVRLVYATGTSQGGHNDSTPCWFFVYKGAFLYVSTERDYTSSEGEDEDKSRIEGIHLTTERCQREGWSRLCRDDDRVCRQRSVDATHRSVTRPLLSALQRRARGAAVKAEVGAFVRLLLMAYRGGHQARLLEKPEEVPKDIRWRKKVAFAPPRIKRSGGVITAEGFASMRTPGLNLLRFKLRVDDRRLSLADELVGFVPLYIR